jgi:uncharacterized UBP type Zn finger protein
MSLEVLDPVSTKTVQSLVEAYGFDLQRSVDAVASLGDGMKDDIQAAIDWLLSHGEEDQGGAVVFQHCPHLDSEEVRLVEPESLHFGEPCARGCGARENWVCMCCGATHCSRYEQGHSLAHREETRLEASEDTVDESPNSRLGHICAMSLGDLSIWCFACDAYVEHPRLKALAERMEKAKFGEASGSAAQSAITPGALSSKAVGKRVARDAPGDDDEDDD